MLPLSEGGSDEGSNLLTLCGDCFDIVDAHEPPLRNRDEIVGSVDERDWQLAEIQDEASRWSHRKRKPAPVFAPLAHRLRDLGLMTGPIADILGVSDVVAKKLLAATLS